MKKTLLTTLLCLLAVAATAKSLVLTLNDSRSTRVYYLLSKENPPKMAMNDDGTFTLNGKEYSFSNIKQFAISSTDYAGERNTIDGIVAIQNDEVVMQGTLRVYGINGQLVQTVADRAALQSLPSGTYVITNGTTTLKLHKK